MNTSDTCLSYWELPTACCIEPDVFHHIPRILAMQHANRIAQLTTHVCCGRRRDPNWVQLCLFGQLQCHETQLH